MRIKFIGPSWRSRSDYFWLRDQLWVVVDGVRPPPVPKPICSAICVSRASLCLRMSRLSFERSDCFARRDLICVSNSCRCCELERIWWFKSLSWDCIEDKWIWFEIHGASKSDRAVIMISATQIKNGLEVRCCLSEKLFISILFKNKKLRIHLC